MWSCLFITAVACNNCFDYKKRILKYASRDSMASNKAKYTSHITKLENDNSKLKSTVSEKDQTELGDLAKDHGKNS